MSKMIFNGRHRELNKIKSHPKGYIIIIIIIIVLMTKQACFDKPNKFAN
jgi:hypothetical protein